MVLAIHEVSALVPLILKCCGLLNVPFVIVNMALLHPKQTSGFRGYVWRWVLRRVEQIVSLASPQLANLEKMYELKRSVLSFTPMPVDAAFFQKAVSIKEERFCLAVGTNDGKDFETLVSALPLGERLIVVTDSLNAEKVRRHRCFGAGIEVYEAMQMAELRVLYQKAAVLIVPLIESKHGSGHTVFVEGQALGKIVIVSGVTNMTDYVEDRINAISVRVGDVASMRRAIEEVLNKPGQFEPMRRAAKALAKEHFSVRRYGEKLESVIQKAAGDLAKRCSGENEMGEFKRRKTSDECVS
ncbi:MAG: glycosyltransferase [Verrucomicrobiota bacterium]